ncbi:hypothetical protein EEL30_01145 (plasmid) [Brevibacillus laterosporus]|uniref:Uncharacterized protein n=1 Tax=Brevibacillus laterosporus TaxID=1465 RepID=A0A518V2A0_BRELA|nr:hypothetical protein EEL30_01145 [Brevibacillus laterosporus]
MSILLNNKRRTIKAKKQRKCSLYEKELAIGVITAMVATSMTTSVFASSNPSFLSENHHNQRAISSLMHISPKASSDWDSEYSFNQTYTKKQIVTAIAGGSSAIGLLLKKSKIPDLLYAPLLAMITALEQIV